MECLIGVVCADCVLLASDTSAVQSIVVLKKDEDKVVKIGENAAMAIVGPGGDGYVQIGEMNSVCASERARGRIMPVGRQGAAGVLGSQCMSIVLSLNKLVIFIVCPLFLSYVWFPSVKGHVRRIHFCKPSPVLLAERRNEAQHACRGQLHAGRAREGSPLSKCVPG